MIESKPIQDNFNGLLFERDYNCIVYTHEGKTYFVLEQKMPNLDEAIAENIANETNTL
jgi:hypothetical protein